MALARALLSRPTCKVWKKAWLWIEEARSSKVWCNLHQVDLVGWARKERRSCYTVQHVNCHFGWKNYIARSGQASEWRISRYDESSMLFILHIPESMLLCSEKHSGARCAFPYKHVLPSNLCPYPMSLCFVWLPSTPVLCNGDGWVAARDFPSAFLMLPSHSLSLQHLWRGRTFLLLLDLASPTISHISLTVNELE